ncbi:hypothetical protein H5410_023669 [Solanum commersonii]|uniref:Uncharacterized protein n=1 Tax=Solanum commersonii TaxID=4109 RepID=A0A9J5ZJU1_SOLCO|nr:hypothetical protein H5410_023669 [Solanum commersonii]
MEKLPNRIRLQFVDGKSGKLIEVFQEIVYDNLPLYCNYCKHQGHDKDSCRLISKRNQNNKQIDDTIEGALKGITDSEKYQGDAREMLNEKRKIVDVDQSKATSSDQQLVASTLEQNHVNSMDVDTSNIGVQTTTENKGDCNNQEVATNEVQSKEVGLNLMSNATKSVEEHQELGLILRKNVSSALVSNTIDLGEDSLDEDGVDLGEDSLDEDGVDLGEDSLDEDEEDNMLDICFDRVAREGDISPRQQRSGSNKSKKKTYGRQHSWDGKMTEEFVPRHLPMRQAKQDHLTISIGSTRSNKSIKKI